MYIQHFLFRFQVPNPGLSALVLGISLFFAGCAVSQTTTTSLKESPGSIQKKAAQAKATAQAGDLNKALAVVQGIHKKHPTIKETRILEAQLLHDLGRLPESAAAYDKLLASNDPSLASLLYERGALAFKMKDYGGTINYIQKYLDSKPRSDKTIQFANSYLRNARFAIDAVKSPLAITLNPLPGTVTTPQPEFWPTLPVDNAFMIYSSLQNGQEDLYWSQNTAPAGQAPVWDTGKPLTDINTSLNEGTSAISPDGRLLVFTACNYPGGLGNCDLYYSYYVGKKWTKPENMGSPINTRSWEGQPTLSSDGRTLYWASERPGGKGGRDIWRSTYTSDKGWATPQNLDSLINTPENDQAPFLHPGGNTLYFMSQGHPGMGGYDLFYATLQPTRSWGNAVNLGVPINTSEQEGTFCVSADGKTAYFSRDKRQANGQITEADIYTFDMPESLRPQAATYVRILVTDADTDVPLSVTVEMQEANADAYRYAVQTDVLGAAVVPLPLGGDYAFYVSKPGYVYYSDRFSLENTPTDKPVVLQIRLKKIGTTPPAGEEVVLKNVFFATGSTQLDNRSTQELDRLAALLSENPSLTIRINGHTDNVGNEQDNKVLSQGRAEAVLQYLVRKSIAPNRLQAQGFGESQPVADNTTEAGRTQNRRTSFTILR